MTVAEFYRVGGKMVASVHGVGAVPREGDRISIRGQTWRVECVTWAVDQADSADQRERRLRANIEVVEEPTP